jgi:hypothetical protein
LGYLFDATLLQLSHESKLQAARDASRRFQADINHQAWAHHAIDFLINGNIEFASQQQLQLEQRRSLDLDAQIKRLQDEKLQVRC